LARIEDFDGYNFNYDINIHINNLEETIGNLLSKFCKMFGINQKNYCFIFKGKSIDNEPNKTLSELDLPKDSNCLSINIVNKHDISGAGDAPTLQIFIKFIKFNNYSKFNCNVDLKGILKLCLLNEITSKWNDINLNEIKKFSEIAYFIMKILKYSYIPSLYEKEANKNIKEVLEKVSGSNIISFSNFVEEEINSDCLNKIMNFLNKNDLTEINDIKFCLGKYNKYMTLFEKEFQNSLKHSIFEFSVISLVVLDREDFDTFETEREKCPNRIEQILYHGTQIHPISCILTGMFRKSTERCYQHGKGVYFTDNLDYCWFYGGSKNNRANTNNIPKIGEFFTAIASCVYYNKNGLLKVKDYKTRIQPGKNEINFAYAGCDLETIDNPDFSKFV